MMASTACHVLRWLPVGQVERLCAIPAMAPSRGSFLAALRALSQVVAASCEPTSACVRVLGRCYGSVRLTTNLLLVVAVEAK